MNKPAVSEMLLARLDTLVPDYATLLLASPGSNVNCEPLCRQIADAATRLGRPGRVVALPGATGLPHAAPSQRERESVSEGALPGAEINLETLRHRAAARSSLSSFDGLSVVVGRGILDDPATLMAIGAVDCVILVARVGKTLRADLDKARVQVEHSGAAVTGAIELY